MKNTYKLLLISLITIGSGNIFGQCPYDIIKPVVKSADNGICPKGYSSSPFKNSIECYQCPKETPVLMYSNSSTSLKCSKCIKSISSSGPYASYGPDAEFMKELHAFLKLANFELINNKTGKVFKILQEK
jgi:ribosomal protein S27E